MTLRRPVRSYWHAPDFLPATAGIFAGAAMVLNHFAELPARSYGRQQILVSLSVGAIASAGILLLSHRLIVRSMARFASWNAPEATAFATRQAATYLFFLFFIIGGTGFRLPGVAFSASIVALFALANAFLLVGALPEDRKGPTTSPARVAVLFFVSGVAALVYQVTWQRALSCYFGVNIESATLVVAIFMFGLGIGSVAGGLFSRRADSRTLIKGFLACELSVGAFGLISVPLIRAVGSLTLSSSLPLTALVIFGLLSIPTLLMGATLPLLVSYTHRQLSNVGRSVGLLYFVNTIGSAFACYLTADVLFVLGGEHAATIVAASLNFGVGFAVHRMLRRAPVDAVPQGPRAEPLTVSQPESVR